MKNLGSLFVTFVLFSNFVSDSNAAEPYATAPSSGLLNDWLRKEIPAATNWDIGGQFRIRYEDKENAGAVANRDFIRHGQDNSKDGVLFREKFHVGYTPQSWVTVYAEGRDSRSTYEKNPTALARRRALAMAQQLEQHGEGVQIVVESSEKVGDFKGVHLEFR